MSYFGFLIRFLIVPILVLLGVIFIDRRLRVMQNAKLSRRAIWTAIALHMGIAFIYTTPWDNYLVATRVWWYDPALVTGITFGWVPIEEYTFFLLQPLLGGLWIVLLLSRYDVPPRPLNVKARTLSTLLVGIIWVASLVLLLSGWQPGNYLALELVWALPPVALQLAFGADILWRHRRHVFLAIVPLTVYLSAADALAIDLGTWTINPAKSLNIYLGTVLPIEELLFFLLTNTLVTFGLILVWSEESHRRLATIREWVASKIDGRLASDKRAY